MLTVSLDSCPEIECPFSGVTKSGRVWRKVPESDAWSVRRLNKRDGTTAGVLFRCKRRFTFGGVYTYLVFIRMPGEGQESPKAIQVLVVVFVDGVYTYLVFTRMPGEGCHRRRFRSLTEFIPILLP